MGCDMPLVFRSISPWHRCDLKSMRLALLSRASPSTNDISFELHNKKRMRYFTEHEFVDSLMQRGVSRIAVSGSGL